jgi:hypothetical protein
MADMCLRFIETDEIDVIMFSINAAYDLDPVGNVPFEDLDMAGQSQLSVSKDRIKLYQECQKRGIGIQVMKAYGGGTLLNEGTSPFGQAMTVAQCIQYALDRPAVLSCMLGVRSKDDLVDAVAYYSASDAERDYAYIAGMQHTDMQGTCVYCNHCLPCPAHIDIGAVHKYLDLYLAGDQLAEAHYKSLPKNASDCIACGLCEPNCPFHVKIIDKMKKAAAVMG